MKTLEIKTRSKGAVLVEFALLLPVFIVLILGVIEAGWALYVQNTLVDAARQGARVAATQNVGTSSIIGMIDNFLQTANINGVISVSITPLAISLQPRGTPITVNVSMPYNGASILPTPLFLGSTTLEAQVTMSKEY